VTARLAIALLVLLFTAAAAVKLVTELRNRPLIDLAITLEAVDNPVPPGEDLTSRLEAEIARRRGCDHLLARSRVTASIFLLENSKNDEEFRKRLVETERQARDALACNPLDGNLWFVAGWLGFHLVPNKELLHEFVLNAIRFAPTNGSALKRRWQVLAPHLKSLGYAEDPVIVGDLETLYLLSPAVTVAKVHDMLLRNGSNSLAKRLLVRVEPKRRFAVEQQLEILASPGRPREFLRFGPRTKDM
jgi:hypothetical protein